MGYSDGAYKWRGAFVTAAQLTDTYLVSAFPLFTDMKPRSKWFNPSGSNVYNQAVTTEQTLYGGSKFIGNENFSWVFSALTPSQLNWLLYDSSMFNGASELESTCETWDMARNTWEIIWAMATIGTISESGETGYRRGLQSLTVNFNVKQDAP
jgi:hypothetical protein